MKMQYFEQNTAITKADIRRQREINPFRIEDDSIRTILKKKNSITKISFDITALTFKRLDKTSQY